MGLFQQPPVLASHAVSSKLAIVSDELGAAKHSAERENSVYTVLE
jgi:hypothetical protein